MCLTIDPNAFVTVESFANMGLSIGASFINHALRTFWSALEQDAFYQRKDFLPEISKTEFGFHSVYFKGYYFQKVILSGNPDVAPDTSLKIEERLWDADTKKRLMQFDGSEISNGRTGHYAKICFDLCLSGRKNVNVFLFGGGGIAKAVVRALNITEVGAIGCVYVKTTSAETAAEAVKAMNADNPYFEVVAVVDCEHLKTADFVITATNAGKPLYEVEDIKENATTLSLGKNDTPEDRYNQVINAGGYIIGDDFGVIEARGTSALGLYYAKLGMRLSQMGKEDGFLNYSAALRAIKLIYERSVQGKPFHFEAIGLPALDAWLTVFLYCFAMGLPFPVFEENASA